MAFVLTAIGFDPYFWRKNLYDSERQEAQEQLEKLEELRNFEYTPIESPNISFAQPIF